MQLSMSRLSLRRGTFPYLATLLLSLILFNLISTASADHHNPHYHKRDAFTRARGTKGDKHLRHVGETPAGAEARSLNVGTNSTIFTWYSKTPHREADAESAFVIIHGVNRNANTYWRILNNAWAKARDLGIGSARNNSIRVAPLFFSTIEDKGAYIANELAWGDSNAWTAGEASTHPVGSAVSSFTVLDTLLTRFANRAEYPKMKYITFVAHGGGAQMLQRYAVMGLANPAPSRLSVRYVVGDPSSQLYFTADRPVGVNKTSCPEWNNYRYGTKQYTSNYGSLNLARAPTLFKSYANKEVRYVVGLNDTTLAKGDQTCMALAVGGPKRRNRNLAYWKYIHLLSGADPDLFANFPGTFPSLDAKYGATNQTDIPRTGMTTAKKFRGTTLRHTLSAVPGAGHSASKVYGSEVGRNALFGDQVASGGTAIGDAYKDELVGYTADAANAKDYNTSGEDDEDD